MTSLLIKLSYRYAVATIKGLTLSLFPIYVGLQRMLMMDEHEMLGVSDSMTRLIDDDALELA